MRSVAQHYSIAIEEYADHRWVPFRATDVQFELIRLDLFTRANMSASPAHAGQFWFDFKIPDVYGVYKFVVDYRRLGYTYLYASVEVPVRPLRHTQYERFIQGAYPYYTSALVLALGFFLFTFVFLYHTDKVKRE